MSDERCGVCGDDATDHDAAEFGGGCGSCGDCPGYDAVSTGCAADCPDDCMADHRGEE